MRWDCAKSGCFNICKRPKIEAFAPFLPPRVSFTDIDGVCQVGAPLFNDEGCFIFIEWKEGPGPEQQPEELPAGQRRLMAALTKHLPHAIGFAVAGDAETMRVDWVQRHLRGGRGGWKRSSFDELGQMMREWWEQATAVQQ